MPWNHNIRDSLDGIEGRYRSYRVPEPAATTFLQISAGKLAALIMATVTAQESIGPSPLFQGNETLPFGSVVLEKLVQAEPFRELNRIEGHGKFPFLSKIYMAISTVNVVQIVLRVD